MNFAAGSCPPGPPRARDVSGCGKSPTPWEFAPRVARRVLILADGREVDAAQLRTCRTLNLDSLLGQGPAPIAEADIAMLRGIIWRNPHLEPNAAVAKLNSRAFVNSEEYRWGLLSAGTEEDAERTYMEWARGWAEWARARGTGQSSGR